MRYEVVEKRTLSSTSNAPVSVISQALSMLPETEIIPKVYSLDIHLDIQLNIGLSIHHVLYIFGVSV